MTSSPWRRRRRSWAAGSRGCDKKYAAWLPPGPAPLLSLLQRRLTSCCLPRHPQYEGVHNYKTILEAAQALRKEHERADQLSRQREDQTNQVRRFMAAWPLFAFFSFSLFSSAPSPLSFIPFSDTLYPPSPFPTQLALTEAKLQRTVQTLREARANAITGGPDGVLARAEEELKMNEYLSQEKLPQALRERESLRSELERVANEPAMSNSDLDTLHQQVGVGCARAGKGGAVHRVATAQAITFLGSPAWPPADSGEDTRHQRAAGASHGQQGPHGQQADGLQAAGVDHCPEEGGRGRALAGAARRGVFRMEREAGAPPLSHTLSCPFSFHAATQLAALQRDYDEKKGSRTESGPRMLKADEVCRGGRWPATGSVAMLAGPLRSLTLCRAFLQFKRYVAKLRTKSTTYKEKKAAVSRPPDERRRCDVCQPFSLNDVFSSAVDGDPVRVSCARPHGRAARVATGGKQGHAGMSREGKSGFFLKAPPLFLHIADVGLTLSTRLECR